MTRLVKLIVLIAILVSIPTLTQAQIRREVWLNVDPTTLQNLSADPGLLAANPDMLGAPSLTDVISSGFEQRAPGHVQPVAPLTGQYVARYMAKFTAPTSGNYIFECSGNQKMAAYVNIDTPVFTASATRKCRVTSPTPFQFFYMRPEQRSVPQALIGNVRTYYGLVILVESDTDNVNHMSFRWKLPSLAYETPIPLSRLTPWSYIPAMNITFDANPLNITTVDQQVDLTWNVVNSTGCTASSNPAGSTWTGTKNLSGLLSLYPLFTTAYDLTCVPADGTSPQTVSRTVTNNVYSEPFQLTWDPSTDPENVTRYRVLYSLTQGTYSIDNSWDAGLSTSIVLSGSNFPITGNYYFVVVAEGSDPGVRSDYSNEVFTFVWVPGT